MGELSFSRWLALAGVLALLPAPRAAGAADDLAAARRDYFEAQRHVNGLGVRKNELAAARLFGRACRAGLVKACQALDRVSVVNKKVAGIERAVLKQHLAGCSKERAHACTCAGLLSTREQSLDLFWPACDGGLMDACIRLANLHKGGFGLPRDSAKAEALYLGARAEGDEPGDCTALDYRLGDDPTLGSAIGPSERQMIEAARKRHKPACKWLRR